MSNHRWCCCDGAIDCCDMQSCANFVTPTQINIQYSGVITRTLSTGQSFVVADYTWNINSNSAFTMRGNNCTGDSPREFGCPTAMLDYTYNSYYWLPKTFNQTDNDPPLPCDSCDGLNCDWDGSFCLQDHFTAYGLPRQVTGADVGFPSGCCQGRTSVEYPPPVLRLICCDICGCARPTILYTPSVTIWATPDDFYVSDTDQCCYYPPFTPPGPVTTPSTWVFPQFQMSGKCGCPDGSTWDAPPGPYAEPTCPTIPTVPGNGLSGWPGVGSCPVPDCNGLPQQVTTIGGPYTWTWQCELILNPPPQINFCSETVTYTDTCQHSLTIVVA